MNASSNSNDHLVRSYLSLRKSIGVIGIALPFVLALGGALLTHLVLQPVFWLEAAAIVAFGVSWLTKGEAILKDTVPEGEVAASERTAPHIPGKEEMAAKIPA